MWDSRALCVEKGREAHMKTDWRAIQLWSAPVSLCCFVVVLFSVLGPFLLSVFIFISTMFLFLNVNVVLKATNGRLWFYYMGITDILSSVAWLYWTVRVCSNDDLIANRSVALNIFRGSNFYKKILAFTYHKMHLLYLPGTFYGNQISQLLFD